MEHYYTNNENLKSELRVIKYSYQEYSFMFYSDNGVFSKDKIDYASRLMFETCIQNYKKAHAKILDVGCGYGFLGISLSKILAANVLMTDVNKRALHLTEKNILENKVNAQVIYSDKYESVVDTYDLIITNPPIRAGKETVLAILRESFNFLEADGELWFVIHKDQGAKGMMKLVEDIYNLEVIEKNKGFFVIRAKKR